MEIPNNKISTSNFLLYGGGQLGTALGLKATSLPQKDKVRVTAIIEPNKAKHKELRKKLSGFGVRPLFLESLSQISQMPESTRPTAAIVTVPSSLQVRVTKACMKKGLHCLVEKPLGFSALDHKELQKVSDDKNVYLRVFLPERWTLARLWSHWVPRNSPWTISGVRSEPFQSRTSDMHVIHDLMIHDIDTFVLLSDFFKIAPVKKVKSWGRKLRSNNLDYASATLELEDGGVAHFEATRLSTDIRRYWDVTGKDWHASIDFAKRSMHRFAKKKTGPEFSVEKMAWSNGDAEMHAIKSFVYRINDIEDSKKYDFSKLTSLSSSPKNTRRTHLLMDKILSNLKVIPS